MTKSGDGESKNTLYCSFCGKSQHEVRKLIAGPTVFICDECVELCMDIIREENKTSLVKSRDGVPTPTEICTVLDDYVIGQFQAKRVLSVAVLFQVAMTAFVYVVFAGFLLFLLLDILRRTIAPFYLEETAAFAKHCDMIDAATSIEPRNFRISTEHVEKVLPQIDSLRLPVVAEGDTTKRKVILTGAVGGELQE